VLKRTFEFQKDYSHSADKLVQRGMKIKPLKSIEIFLRATYLDFAEGARWSEDCSDKNWVSLYDPQVTLF